MKAGSLNPTENMSCACEVLLSEPVLRAKSHAYPAGQYDLTSGYGAFEKTRFACPVMFRGGLWAGDSTPVCTTSGEPSTRLPLGGLGQLVPLTKAETE